MGLIFDVLSAINNPNQQGSVDQLGAIVNSIQQLAPGVDASTTQTALSALTGVLRSTLKQQSSTGNPGALEGMLSQFAGSAGLPALLNNPQMHQQIAQAVAQKTGLNASMVQTLLPGLLTAALGFLKIGDAKPGTGASNSVLSAFLNSDGDGKVDLGDAFKFASRFFNPPAQVM